LAALIVLSVSAAFIAIAWGAPTSHPRIWQWVVAAVTITGMTVGAFRLVRAIVDLLINGSPD
jgi:TRAP-type C4-dicarboxylate transport system permease small subunit